MKQLLPAAILAIAIHGLLIFVEVPWFKKTPVKPELRTISVVLTRERADKPPAPAMPPPKQVTPVALPEPERTVTPVPAPPEKITPRKTEEKKSAPVKKKVPAPRPPSVIEAKPDSPVKDLAEPVARAAEADPGQEEIKAAPASRSISPSISQESVLTAAAEGGRISEARPLYKKNPHPHYPDIARRRNAQGTVVILALVNEKGRVEEARVETSSGHVLLDNAAITAVTSWEFEPGRRGGVAVKSYVKLPITFRLK